MVTYLVQFKAHLENIREIEFSLESIEWCFDVKEATGDEQRNQVTLRIHDEFLIPNSRGNANLIIKWNDSKRHASIKLLEIKSVTKSKYTTEENEQFISIIGLDCRQVIPLKYYPDIVGIHAVSSKGTRFENINLSESDWWDYDDKGMVPVGIQDIQWEIVSHK